MAEPATTASEAEGLPSPEAGELRYLEGSDAPALIRISHLLRDFVDRVGRFGSWMIVPLVLITMFDVTARKTGTIQIWLKNNMGPMFDSTVMQELEWHFHTALFALVLGYGYIWNTHVRVDLVRENLKFEKKAWMEFTGITLFLLPYCFVVSYFACIYAYDALVVGVDISDGLFGGVLAQLGRTGCAGEISASTVGLCNRWFIKGVLVVGLLTAAIAGICVWLQMFFILFGERNVRFDLTTLDWPEDDGDKIEGKERLKLEELEDLVEMKSREMQERIKRSGAS